MNPALVKQQIANLRMSHPELAEDEDAWLLSLESETDVLELFRDVERRRQSAASLAGAIGSNIAELELRQQRFERREKALRELMFRLMQTGDLRKLELPEATLSVTNGKPKVLITDEDAVLYHGFGRVKYEPDKQLIRETLDAGQEVPGAVLSNSEPHLVVRTR